MGKRGPKPKDPARVGNYNYNSDGTKRDHTLNLGKRMDQRRIDRAEELFTGIGPEGVPLPLGKIYNVLAAEFKVSYAQARLYVKFAKERLAERFASFDAEACIEQTDEMFLSAFAMAHKLGDPSAMVQSAHRRAELRGIFRAKQEVDVKINGLGELFAQQFTKDLGVIMAPTVKELPGIASEVPGIDEDPFGTE